MERTGSESLIVILKTVNSVPVEVLSAFAARASARTILTQTALVISMGNFTFTLVYGADSASVFFIEIV